MINVTKSAKTINDFCENDLSIILSQIESKCYGKKKTSLKGIFKKYSIQSDLLEASYKLQTVTSQIYIINHAIGILLSLPYILEKDEIILSLSLGAGSTGKDFDLETDKRIAEFKFIRWQKGSNTIRQNSVFKDFFYLTEYKSRKKKYLYLTELERPLQFLNGERALESIMSKNIKLFSDFKLKYKNEYEKVNEYFKINKDKVNLVNITELVPRLFDII